MVLPTVCGWENALAYHHASQPGVVPGRVPRLRRLLHFSADCECARARGGVDDESRALVGDLMLGAQSQRTNPATTTQIA